MKYVLGDPSMEKGRRNCWPGDTKTSRYIASSPSAPLPGRQRNTSSLYCVYVTLSFQYRVSCAIFPPLPLYLLTACLRVGRCWPENGPCHSLYRLRPLRQLIRPAGCWPRCDILWIYDQYESQIVPLCWKTENPRQSLKVCCCSCSCCKDEL